MTSKPRTEESIFAEVLAEPEGAARVAFLDAACGSDADLRLRVEQLLKSHTGAGSFLRKPLAATAEHTLVERPGMKIGPYKLLQQIGEGGMGVVYMAEQEQPIRRRVALKIIKPGMDSQQVIARFEAERQALAMMDHLNIAKVLDAGATNCGRPYFVMELVHGVPITKYCDDNHLSPRQRLDLFMPVCQAIQHAHQKGIIHRDIKPSNVLVCLYDGKPVSKVIDFGIAKAIDQRLTERTLFTQFGNIIGTFEYMSPEQAEMSQLGTDTRSDIYSLGVLLYELLTGTTPHDRQKLRSAALDEMLRMIREEEPPKPSTRIANSESLPGVAASRNIEPAKLARLVRGDLDWIVMKCLEKDRTRRYETANGLARDISRYLSDEPVEACPPSAAYRLRKLVRRNKGPILAAALVLLALLIGITGTTWGLIRAEASRKAAVEQRLQAESERQRALDAEKRAQQAARENEDLSNTREQARQETASKLFDALIRESRALKLARQPGYRSKVWANLKQAVVLDFPAKNMDLIREVAVETLGDPIGLDTVIEPTVQLLTPPNVSDSFSEILRSRIANPRTPHSRQYAVDRSGKWLAMLAQSKIVVWSAEGKQVASCEFPYETFSSLADMTFTADGNLLIAGTDIGLLIWSVPDLSIRNALRSDRVIHIAASPDNRVLATLNRGKRVEVLLKDSSRPFAAFVAPEHTRMIEFSQDGAMLVALTEAGQPLLGWSITRTPERKHLAGLQRACRTRFSPDGGKIVATAANSGTTVDVWDTASGASLLTFRGHSDNTTAVAFNPDGRVVASGDVNGHIHLWECDTGRRLGTTRAPTTPNRPYVWQLEFACQGRVLISAGDSGVNAWTVETKGDEASLKQFLSLPMSAVRNVAVHPDGTTVVFANYGGIVYQYDLRSAQAPTRLAVDSMNMYGIGRESIFAMESLHFDAFGRRLVFATPDSKAGVWDWNAKRVSGKTSSNFLPLAFALTGRGRWLAGTRPANRAVVADLDSGTETLWLPEETSSIFSLDWSRDSRFLALGQIDGVSLWDLEEVRRQLAPLGIDLPSTAAGSERVPAFEALSTDELKQVVEKNREVKGREWVLFAEWESFLHSDFLAGVGESLKGDFLAGGVLHPEHFSQILNLLREELVKVPDSRETEVQRALSSISNIYSAAGNKTEVIQLWEVNRDYNLNKYGPDDSKTWFAQNNLGVVYYRNGQLTESTKLFEDLHRLQTAKLGIDHPDILRTLSNLASNYTSAGRTSDALATWEDLLPRARRSLGPTHATTTLYMNNWTDALNEAGEFDKSIAIQRESIAAVRENFPAPDARLGSALATLGMTLLKAKQFAAAEPILKESLAIREQGQPDLWSTFNAKSMLGGALLGQQKYADAEPFLLSGYEGMKTREDKIPVIAQPRLTEALKRLVDLYVAWDKPAEAANWQKMLDDRNAAKKHIADAPVQP